MSKLQGVGFMPARAPIGAFFVRREAELSFGPRRYKAGALHRLWGRAAPLQTLTISRLPIEVEMRNSAST
jgi:hypothetical protein